MIDLMQMGMKFPGCSVNPTQNGAGGFNIQVPSERVRSEEGVKEVFRHMLMADIIGRCVYECVTGNMMDRDLAHQGIVMYLPGFFQEGITKHFDALVAVGLELVFSGGFMFVSSANPRKEKEKFEKALSDFAQLIVKSRSAAKMTSCRDESGSRVYEFKFFLDTQEGYAEFLQLLRIQIPQIFRLYDLQCKVFGTFSTFTIHPCGITLLPLSIDPRTRRPLDFKTTGTLAQQFQKKDIRLENIVIGEFCAEEISRIYKRFLVITEAQMERM